MSSSYCTSPLHEDFSLWSRCPPPSQASHSTPYNGPISIIVQDPCEPTKVGPHTGHYNILFLYALSIAHLSADAGDVDGVASACSFPTRLTSWSSPSGTSDCSFDCSCQLQLSVGAGVSRCLFWLCHPVPLLYTDSTFVSLFHIQKAVCCLDLECIKRCGSSVLAFSVRTARHCCRSQLLRKQTAPFPLQALGQSTNRIFYDYEGFLPAVCFHSL